MMSTNFEVDANLGAAYLQLSDGEVVETIEFNESVQVDVDEDGHPIGIELLDLSAEVPTGELAARFALTPEQQIVLIRARTALASFAVMSTSSTGVVSAHLQPA